LVEVQSSARIQSPDFGNSVKVNPEAIFSFSSSSSDEERSSASASSPFSTIHCGFSISMPNKLQPHEQID